MVSWALEIEKRRGKFIATVALAGKIAGILYAIWRDGTIYSAEHAEIGTHRFALKPLSVAR